MHPPPRYLSLCLLWEDIFRRAFRSHPGANTDNVNDDDESSTWGSLRRRREKEKARPKQECPDPLFPLRYLTGPTGYRYIYTACKQGPSVLSFRASLSFFLLEEGAQAPPSAIPGGQMMWVVIRTHGARKKPYIPVFFAHHIRS